MAKTRKKSEKLGELSSKGGGKIKVSPPVPKPPKPPKAPSKPTVGKVSPKPAGKGQGATGVSKTQTKPITPKSTPKPNDFVEDIKLDDIIQPDLPPNDDFIGEDIGKATKEILQDEKSKLNTKPLSPEKAKSEEEELEDIIKTVEKEVDTPNNVGGKPKIDDSDKTSEEEFLDKITKQEKETEIKVKPVPVKVVKASELEEPDRIRLDKEEEKRREIEKQRDLERKEAIEDENKRRRLFDSEIEQKKKEFQLLLDEKFPEFSKRNSKNLKKFSKEELEAREKQRLDDRKKVFESKQKIKEEKKVLQQKKVVRLKNEQNRKSEESKFKVNRLRKSEVQTFFEGDVLLEQKEKQERNPDINNETEVQTKLREITRLEKQLGRKVVPHRDIVESEESDFDLNSDNTPDDIFIVVPKDNKPLKEYNKLNKLVNIRKALDKNKVEDEDYVLTRKPSPKEIPLFREKRGN